MVDERPSLTAAVGRAIVVGRLDMPAEMWLHEHVHPEHQLNWTSRGVVGIRVGTRSWVLPPTLALWLPAGTPHRTGATRSATLRSLFLSPSAHDPGWREPTPVAVDGLLVHLADHLDRDDLDAAARARAEAVVLDALRPLPTRPVEIVDPLDPRARVVADALMADPADPRGLDGFAAVAGAGRRTLSRLFVAETGLSFDRWRTRVRIRAALPLLAEGLPLTRVARAVGYATPSAFVAAFRRVVGTTPQAYLRPGRSGDDAGSAPRGCGPASVER